MLNQIIGSKINQSQLFDGSGLRIPVTNILAGPCIVVRFKKKEIDGYNAVIVGFGQKRPNLLNKAIKGTLDKAGIKDNSPRFFRELKLKIADSGENELKAGSQVRVSDVFKEGDLVEIIGTSSGKGFAGAVKRHHFKGGPRTHGQSDRERAPGSIGQSTTPGRVYKGKRMAGRMGSDRVTVKNLKIIKVDADKNLLTVKGLVTGKRNSLLLISKMPVKKSKASA